MALEAVIFQQDLFGYSGKESYNTVGGNWGCDFGVEINLEDEIQTKNFHYENWNPPPLDPSMLDQFHHRLFNSSSTETEKHTAHNGLSPEAGPLQPDGSSTVGLARPKRQRRVRCRKNEEDIESQRMTHIAVERNRRKQMNQYLSALRSLMPDSYVPRGDQASIIGGAINYVKELEQRLQFLGTNKKEEESDSISADNSIPFSEFFAFPQFSTSSPGAIDTPGPAAGIADVEVTLVESHASIKIRTERRPKQLLRMVSELHALRLTILHLNVTTVDQIVLYSLSVKVEDECRLHSADEIATAVHEMIGRIQGKPILNI